MSASNILSVLRLAVDVCRIGRAKGSSAIDRICSTEVSRRKNMKNKKLSLVVLCCLLLAGLMFLGFNRHAVADALQDLHGDHVFANYLFTENVISSSLRVQGDKLRINMAGGDGGFGMTSGVGIAAGKSVLQGVDWSPAIQIVGSPGTHIYGPLAFANNSGRGPGVQPENCIGLGVGAYNNGCDIEADSSDGDGQIWLTAGSGAG